MYKLNFPAVFKAIFSLLFSIILYSSMIEKTFAQHPTQLLEELQFQSFSANPNDVPERLSELVLASNNLSENDFMDISAKASLILREHKQLDASVSLARWLASSQAQELNPPVRYRWMMINSYDLMFFAHYLTAKEMIEPQLDSIKAWQTQSPVELNIQANLFHIYGQLLVRQKRVADALPYFYEALAWFKSIDQNHPSIFVINLVLGEAFLHANDYVKAEQFLRKAIELIPAGRVDAISYLYGNLALALNRQQKHNEALEVIETYLADPVDPRRDYLLFFCLVQIDVLRSLNRFDEALQLANDTHQLALEVGDKDYLKDSVRQLGFLLAENGQLEEAERYLKSAIESPSGIREGNSPEAYLDYVTVLKDLDKDDLALEYYERFHKAYVDEQKHINQIIIRNLEFQQVNQQLEQQQALSQAQLELAKVSESRAHLKTRTFIWASITLALILVFISFMLIKLRSKSAKLHDLAVRDQLTGVGNRHAFLETFNKPKYSQLIIADIDGLKRYNDQFGHLKGDELIQTYASHLLSAIRGSRSKLFRIGGDEFAILVTHSISIQVIEQWILDAVLKTQQSGFEHSSISYGVSSREEAKTDQEFISLADQRMYEMKSNHK
ncbi:sensor domain-containing diguanylate cyclase [Marinomonas epiphytica]